MDDDLANKPLEELLNVKVVSAALHQQNLSDAPGDISVVTAAEIRQWGSRTLGEALRYVRGVYISNDGTNAYLGIRGLGLPGDLGTRVRVMIDGHSLQDDIFGASGFFTNNFPLDINLVERIEILRGATSALYGSSAILCTINVITRRTGDPARTDVHAQLGSQGRKQITATQAIRLAHGMNLLLSASLYNNSGMHQIFFPELAAPSTNYGRAIDVDGDKGYKGFGRLTWGNWSLMGLWSTDDQQQPISFRGFLFNDRGQHRVLNSGLLDLSFVKDLSGDRTFSWRTSYDVTLLNGAYRLLREDGVHAVRQRNLGDWITTKLTYRFADGRSGHLTLGTEGRFDLHATQHIFEVAPVFKNRVRLQTNDVYAGVFAQQEWLLGKRWEITAGARIDESALKQSAISPRAAVLFKATDRSTLKAIYGRGFRNPSNYEQFYENGVTVIVNPNLRSETTNTYEFDWQQQWSKHLETTASAYTYRIHNLIRQTFLPSGLAQFQNLYQVNASGISASLVYLLPDDLQLTTSIEMQDAKRRDGPPLPNSPRQIGKLQLTKGIFRNRFNVGLGLEAMGERTTLAGKTIAPSFLPEAVLSSRVLPGGLQFTAGVRNFTNSAYGDPVSMTPLVDTIPRNSRMFYLNLGWRQNHETESGGSQR